MLHDERSTGWLASGTVVTQACPPSQRTVMLRENYNRLQDIFAIGCNGGPAKPAVIHADRFPIGDGPNVPMRDKAPPRRRPAKANALIFLGRAYGMRLAYGWMEWSFSAASPVTPADAPGWRAYRALSCPHPKHAYAGNVLRPIFPAVA